MSSKVKVTLSLDETLVKELASASRETHAPRSRLVEEALRLWHHRRLEQALKAGYLAMADEDRETAEKHLRAAEEAIK